MNLDCFAVASDVDDDSRSVVQIAPRSRFGSDAIRGRIGKRNCLAVTRDRLHDELVLIESHQRSADVASAGVLYVVDSAGERESVRGRAGLLP